MTFHDFRVFLFEPSLSFITVPLDVEVRVWENRTKGMVIRERCGLTRIVSRLPIEGSGTLPGARSGKT